MDEKTKGLEKSGAENRTQHEVGPVFLMRVQDGMEAGMLENMLDEAGIPVMRKYPETGQLMHLVMGTSLYGTDFYVPSDKLDAAKELLEGIGMTDRMQSLEQADAKPQQQEVQPETTEGVQGDKSISVSIRPMYIEDWPDLNRLWEGNPGVGIRQNDDSVEGIRKFLERNPKSCMVAMAGDVLVGSVLAGHDGRRGYLYHVSVEPSFRQKGIASALVASALETLRAEGIQKAGIVVFAGNEEGNAFWEALGWRCRTDLNYRDRWLDGPEST